MRKLFIILLPIFLFFFGCAHTPLPTASLTNKTIVSSDINNLRFTFIDSRDERLKKEKCFVQQYIYPTWIFTCGDMTFDAPLDTAFKKMFLAHFSSNPDGYHTEVKLGRFQFTWKPHELSGLPIINLFVIAADVEFHGIVKMEMAVLDKKEKYLFSKTYEADVREMKSCNNVIYEAGFDVLNKAFNKVMNEVETDMKRIKFD